MASSKKHLPVDLVARLVSFLDQTIQPGQRLLLGFSGGLDSSVLLHMLVTARRSFDFHLAALHVNHGISCHADAWAQFCAAVCERYAIPLTVVHVDVPRDSGKGIEATARARRYAAFDAEQCDGILLAHHRDDQAETLLLQLLRGAGLKGLSCMAAAVELAAGAIKHPVYRPLLDVSRAELEAYALAHGLDWVEDDSNLDLAYDRNFIRHHVLPEMENRFPAARTTLARSASHFAEASSLLDEIAHEDGSRWISEDRLIVASMHCLSEARAKNLLRYWIRSCRTELPSSRRLNELFRQLHDANGEAQVCIPLTGSQVRLYRGEAWMVKEEAVESVFAGFPWHGEAELVFPGGRLQLSQVIGAGMALDQIVSVGLYFHPRREGLTLRPDPRRPRRKLRLMFQEFGIPPWQRDAMPMLYIGDRLACVPGIGVEAEFQASPDAPGVLVSWTPN